MRAIEDMKSFSKGIIIDIEKSYEDWDMIKDSCYKGKETSRMFGGYKIEE